MDLSLSVLTLQIDQIRSLLSNAVQNIREDLKQIAWKVHSEHLIRG
jgi:hypothetical protein